MADPELKPDDVEKRRTESIKLQFDLYKHLTTLSTGAILLLAAFLEKLFKEPHGKWLVGVSMGCFLLSTVGSVGLMGERAVTMSGTVRTEEDIEFYNRRLRFTMLAYTIAVTALTTFTLMNVF